VSDADFRSSVVRSQDATLPLRRHVRRPEFMEAAMRHPFYMDRLDAKELKTIRRWQAGVVAFYSAVLVLTFVAVKFAPMDLSIRAMAQSVAVEAHVRR
jgi:hypothetical protein